MIKKHFTRTGCIISDTDKHMEYLYVGDYGKENNIKADFLGLHKVFLMLHLFGLVI